jgi:hypothetical protein
MARETPTIPVIETALDLSRGCLPQTVSVMFLITDDISFHIHAAAEDKPKASLTGQF